MTELRKASGPSRRVAAIIALAAIAVMLYFADRTVIAVSLLLVSAVFILLVALLAVLVAIVSIGNPPVWMLDADGQLLGFAQRMRLAVRQWTGRAKARPKRSPERVYLQLLRDSATQIWHGPTGPVAYSHLHVELHPTTLRAIDAWMPIEDVASEVASHYSSTHQRTPRKTAAVVVLVSSDPAIPLGVGRISGAFREARPLAPQARAWAELRGPADKRPVRPAERLAPVTLRRGGTQVLGPEQIAEFEDTTAVLLGQPRDRTRLDSPTEVLGSHRTDDETVVVSDIPVAVEAPTQVAVDEQPRAVLTLRRCSPDGLPQMGAETHRLETGRGWLVGRDPASDIVLAEGHVSRTHLEFVPTESGWSVVDRSTLGTKLNDQPIPRGTAVPVSAGDVLELGSKPGQTRNRVLLAVR